MLGKLIHKLESTKYKHKQKKGNMKLKGEYEIKILKWKM